MIAAQINVDEDATDEEVEEDAVVCSDEEAEKDEVIFDSDEDDDDSDENNDDLDEDDDDSDENDDDSDENDDDSDENDDDLDVECLKDTESENSYYEEEAQEDSPTKSKDDKLKNKSKSKESLTVKGKTSTSREITPVINKLKNDKNRKGFDKTHKDDADKKQEIKDISTNDEDEYVYDSSDEEDIRNTVGNVPMKWYDEYDHLGYDWEGKKIPKPEKGDELDNFLKRMEDPDFWRTIKDPQTGQDVVLSNADIDLIVRIQKQKVPDVQFDEYAVSYIYDNLV